MLAAAGLFYGLLGFLWLGVAIDVVLILASVALGAVTLRAHGTSRALRPDAA